MTLEEFGRFLNTKSIGRVEPPINEQMTERVYTAMKKIAQLCIPIKWTVDEASGYEVFRKPDEHTFIRFPKKAILNSGEDLDIEDELMDALALYVMAGLEVQRAKILMAMFYSEIDAYNAKMIETYLVEASNDAPRYHVFP